MFVSQAKCVAKLGDAMQRNLAAEQRAPVARRDPAHADVVGWQLVPDRQQQPGREVKAFALVAGGRLADLGLPEAMKLGRIGRLPAALTQLIGGKVAALQWPDELEARDSRPIVSEQAAGRDKQPDPTRAAVAHHALALARQTMQLLQARERQRPQCAGDFDFEETRCRA